jgi:hypothetical protein
LLKLDRTCHQRGSFNKRSELQYLSTFINKVADKKPWQDFKGNRPRTGTEISLCHLGNVTPSPSSWIAVISYHDSLSTS